MVSVIELYEEVIHLHKNLVSYFFSMEGGIRPWRLDFCLKLISTDSVSIRDLRVPMKIVQNFNRIIFN